MPIDCTFSQWIKQRRRVLDLTQSELAARMGCAVSTLQKFEEGSRRPSKQMAALLATHLELPTAEKHAFFQQARGIQVIVPLVLAFVAALVVEPVRKVGRVTGAYLIPYFEDITGK